MKLTLALLCTAIAASSITSSARAAARDADDCWSGYLDYAYVYSSAEPRALRERLERYAGSCGLSLSDHIAEKIEKRAARDPHLGSDAQRRRAIAHLLQYLASDDPRELDAANAAIDRVQDRLGRRENRYWYHYVKAHRALENRRAKRFNREIFALWLGVVSELESPYQTLEALSLNDPASAGFLSALPYLYENVARLVVLRTQRKNLSRGIDPLASIVRMLADGRVGEQTDIIPFAASSSAYLDRVVARLNGPESDGGSLSFTLALFEASKQHARARDLLAREGFSAESVQALRAASGAYSRALRLSDTLQGQCAIYSRALRELGEIYAASERTGSPVEIEIPFSIDGAMKLFDRLNEHAGRGWARQGYRDHGREAFLAAARKLWAEIQETGLNAAAWHTSLGLGSDRSASEHRRQAARIHTHYLAFFRRYTDSGVAETVPASAYFAAYEAARGLGDSIYFDPAQSYSKGELRLAIKHYLKAIDLYPFDRPAREALGDVLERLGDEVAFLRLTKPVAQHVALSPAIDSWVRNGEAASEQIEALRQALADDRVLMYFGFSGHSKLEELESRLAGLQQQREVIAGRRAELQQQQQQLEQSRQEALAAAVDESEPLLPAVSAPAPQSAASQSLSRIEDELLELEHADGLLAIQVEARERALPLYRRALEADGLVERLAAERDHPLHVLLRRIFEERRSGER